ENVSVAVPKLELAGVVKVEPKVEPKIEPDPKVEPKPDRTPPIENEGGPASPGTFTTLRKVSVALAVVGVGASIGGVVIGLKAKDLHSQADDICPMAACNDQHAVDLNNDAQSKAMQANVLFGVGAAGVVGAVVL